MDGPALAALAKALEGFAGRILDYALVLAAIGTVTMALLELLKAVGRARYVFNRRMVERWLRADPAARPGVPAPAPPGAAGSPTTSAGSASRRASSSRSRPMARRGSSSRPTRGRAARRARG